MSMDEELPRWLIMVIYMALISGVIWIWLQP